VADAQRVGSVIVDQIRARYLADPRDDEAMRVILLEEYHRPAQSR